jgi:hypothetical protein
METSTQANSNLRELTKTEIEIAYAQIIDRMTRAIKAANEGYRLNLELAEKAELQGLEEWDGFDDYKALKEKYDIPDGVFIFMDESMGLHSVKDKVMKDLVKHWVCGTLDESECNAAFFYMEAIDEIDWGWVFMERPINYYGVDKQGKYWTEEEAYSEFLKIGTRKNKPHTGRKFVAYINGGEEAGWVLQGFESLKYA